MNVNASLKIVIFDGSFKTTTFINRLATGLAKNHQVYIFGFNTAIDEKLPKVKYIALGSSKNRLSLIWYSISIGVKYFFKTWNVPSLFNLIKSIVSFNHKALKQSNFDKAIELIHPDILHVQWASLLPWCELVLDKKQPKVILSQLGYQTNVRPFVNSENFNYLQKIYPKIDGFHSIVKDVSERGDKIFNSDSKIDYIVNLGFPMESLKFNESLKSNKETLQILSVGRPHWIKGYADAIRACNILKEKGFQFKYTIIGAEGNEELQYLIDNFNLKEQVTLSSKISQGDVYKEMTKASLLLLPSIKEGLPNVIVEAMALGLPVFATRCGGVEGLINHNKNGWLVPAYDHEAIAEALKNYSSLSMVEIEEIRALARKTVENIFSEQEMVDGMEELYFDVLSFKKGDV